MLDVLRRTFATPLYTVLFALGGALLAWLWYAVDEGLPVAIVVILLVLVGGVQQYARSCVTSNPKRALQLMETQLLGIGAASAAAGALAIIIAIEFAVGKDDPMYEIVAAVTTAVAGFITGVTVTGEDADERVGRYVRDTFQARFTMEGEAAEPGRVPLRANSREYYAVFSYVEFGWIDWSRRIRKERIENLARAVGPNSSTS